MPNELMLSVFWDAGRPTTPAWSIAYCSGFCVMLGSDSIILAFMAPSTELLSVWIRPVEAPTSTTSPTELIFSSTAMRTVCAVSTGMLVCLNCEKPASVTETVYGPAGR